MKQTIINKAIEPRCEYCEKSIPAPTENEYFCRVKGLVHSDFYCKKFVYDPLKRQPRALAELSDEFIESDFRL